MFISNNEGEYIKMENIIAISTEDKFIHLYSEKGFMRKEIEAFRPSFPRVSIMNTMKNKYKVEFLRIGNYVFVMSAIDSINWVDEGIVVTTAHRQFRVTLTEDEMEKAANEMRRLLPVF